MSNDIQNSICRGFDFFDAHCDTLTGFDTEKYTFYDADTHFNVKKQLGYSRYVQVADIWVDRARHNVEERITRYINEFGKQLELLKKKGEDCFDVFFIRSKKELRDFYDRSDNTRRRAGLILGIEGGECIDGDEDFAALHKLFGQGVRLITLTWNTPNTISDTNCSASDNPGLTPFGRKVVAEMNRLGMMIDLSHISDRGFWDVLDISKKPVITSHSDSRELCGHSRNLTDDMFMALCKKDGVTGINFCTAFLGGSKDITRILEHIEHFASLGGVDNIGLGSDIDGIDELPGGIDGAESMYKIIDGLLKLNYTEAQARGIAGGNFRRVFDAVLPQ